jgi:hypothetical protein
LTFVGLIGKGEEWLFANGFWPDFAQENGESLGLGMWFQSMLRDRWLGTAGTAVALQLIRRDIKAAAATLLAQTVAYWPCVLLLILRSDWYVHRRVEPLVVHVPASAIYPS